MACSRADGLKEADGQAGYATVAALGVSLAIALLAGSLVVRGVSALKLARADFRRSQAEYALSGAQMLATRKLLNSSGAGRLAWSAGGLDGRDIAMLAEAEGGKLTLAAAAALDDKALVLLGAADPGQTRSRLAGLRRQRDLALGGGQGAASGPGPGAEPGAWRRPGRPGLADPGDDERRVDG